MSSRGNNFPEGFMRAALARCAWFLGLWVVLCGTDPVGLAVGLMAAAAATWTSICLLPPVPGRMRFLSLVLLGLRFFCKSLIAGLDVARRAFDPRLPLQPGFVTYSCRLPRSPAQSVFCAMTSLMPGSVPTGLDEQGRLLMHCLDTRQPLVEQMAAEEARLIRALGEKRPHV
jgi:multicomponent Na+:H+ antiporter subunit E